MIAAGGGAWFVLRPVSDTVSLPEAAAPVPGPSEGPPALAVPRFALRDRAAILAWQPEVPTLARFAERPSVFLLALPDLGTQGRMLNRMAALVEKARAPRDRVLTDRELAAAIAADNERPETYYYGHNYALADMERFFAMAASGDIALNAEERWLLAQMPAIRAAGGTGPLALISLPNEGPDFDADSRRSVLEHEFGHGVFSTDPAYAAQVIRVWREVFTTAERAAFRAFLSREGYDTANETLMANEAYAYLLHTPDRRFFEPRRDVALDDVAVERLRAALRR
ncbi:hypothetical protein ACE7GA_11330 [Roseomonas sp. CCTCC AB2023176]|uniref:hypothetical protein n=1 Tax=Roseomonas sp. CCTCC AB2023176 TaxID=3342640 RepID=UPI0035DE472F